MLGNTRWFQIAFGDDSTSVPQSTQSNQLNPYIVAIPGSGNNQDALFVSASNIGEQIAPVFLRLDDGPTGHIHSHTMEWNSSDQSYQSTLENFFSGSSPIAGSIEITTTTANTETLTSGLRHYERWPVRKEDMVTQLTLADGSLSMLVISETLEAQLSFIVVVDTLAPVNAPTGWYPISHAYSIQASGAVANAEKPYLLTLRYETDLLGTNKPDELAIHWFNPGNNSWQSLGGAVNADLKIVALSTRRFGTFMLFAPAKTVYLPFIVASE